MRLAKGSRRGQVSKLVPAGFLPYLSPTIRFARAAGLHRRRLSPKKPDMHKQAASL